MTCSSFHSSVAYSYSRSSVPGSEVCLRSLPWSGYRLLFFLWLGAAQTEVETGTLRSLEYIRNTPACCVPLYWSSFVSLFQVSDLGCQAFAILFDDIDHSMCQADSEAFTSFAHAQVTVTNEIYRFLGEPPVFLFCPTGKTEVCIKLYVLLNETLFSLPFILRVLRFSVLPKCVKIFLPANSWRGPTT